MIQRFSRKREAILALLRSTATHPTADWIYQQLLPTFPDLSLATVYRNLAQMKEAGLICSVGVVCGQERYDAETRPHTHFVCQNCHGVTDLWEVEVPRSVIRQAEGACGGQIREMSLQFTGLCPSCQSSM